MKNAPRQPRSRSKTAIILGARPSFFGYYFWRLGEAVAGEAVADETLAQRGEAAAGAADEPLVVVSAFSPPFRCDIAAAAAPPRAAGVCSLWFVEDPTFS